MIAALALLALASPAAPAAPRPAPAVVQEKRKDEKRPDFAHLNLDKKGLALSGYDPVAYFPVGGGKPKKGSKDITLVQGGVTWRFASEKHRDLFKAAPKTYEPVYGGWCAYAMASGDKVEIDPKSFLIEEGRLHVFYDSFFADTRKKWLKETGAVLRPKADASWKKFVPPPEPTPKPDGDGK